MRRWLANIPSVALPSTRLTVRLVQSLQQGQVVWDTGVIGLGVRRQTGPVSYVLRYRTQDGRQRTYTIGKHGSPWTPESARAEALRLLGEIVQGRDPSGDKEARRGALTIGDLCDGYLADVESGRLLTRRRTPKSVSTLLSDRGRINGHIRPLLGRLSVSALTRQDIEQFMHLVAEGKTRKRTKLDKAHALSNVRGGRGVASRAVSLLGAMLTYAIQRGMRSDNPVRGVLRYADGRRDRRLADTEYGQLARGLSAAEDLEDWPPALAAIRFLLLTGWRSGEVRTLRWADVDAGRRTVRLAATKTGASMRVLSQAAMTILQAMPRGEYVFPAPGGDTPMSGFTRVWKRMVHRHAGLPMDVTPHVLRHSYASVAADLGYADATIAALLGHKGHSITRRYIHSADTVLLAAADAVAAQIMGLTTAPASMAWPEQAGGLGAAQSWAGRE